MQHFEDPIGPILLMRGAHINYKPVHKAATIFIISLSFLLATNQLTEIGVEARENGRPIGEMISKGQVRFETKKNIWKDVEPFNFPIFYGLKIKTQKGIASIAMEDNSQIEVSKNSLLYFEQDGLHLVQGQINFRISPTAKMDFMVGNLTVTKHNMLQAGKNPSTVFPEYQEIIGSISVHSNGSVTINGIEGELSILDQERRVLATLSSRQSITVPSPITSDKRDILIAQVSIPTSFRYAMGGEFLGMSGGPWGVLAGGVMGIGAVAGQSARKDSGDQVPICP